MFKFPTIQLKHKLPLIIFGFSLMVGVAIELSVFKAYQEKSLQAIEAEFETAAEVRRDALQYWLTGMQEEIELVAASPSTVDAIYDLGGAYRAIPGDATEFLHAAYIDNNPNPAGQRQNLMRGTDDSPYHAAHEIYHPYFLELLQKRGLYDVFLFDTQGNLVYSVYKEADFAINFVAGPFAASGLGEAMQSARAIPQGTTQLVDLAPYAPSNGVLAGFIATPVVGRDGRAVGVIGFQLPIEEIMERLQVENGLGETGNAFLVGPDMTFRTASRFADGFKPMDPAKPSTHIAALFNGTNGFFDEIILQDGEDGMASVQLIEAPGITWGLVVERNMDEVMSQINAFWYEMITILAVCSAVALVLGTFVARSITKPIVRLSGTIQEIGAGNLSVAIDDAARHDELGQIGQSLEGLREKLALAETLKSEREAQEAEQQRVVHALSGGLQNLAAGDLTHALHEPFAADYEALRDDFNKTLDTLNETITKVVEVSESIRARSTEINRASEDLSHRTENQAAALEETAAALDELTASVRSAADGAKKVEGVVAQARREAEESGAVVQGAVAAMTEIEKSSDQISQIIGVIDDIAFQTNLLALNAGVEAARAGDAGKGFAVVASEVRALAQRSSGAAKEIKTLISASTQHVGRGVDQVGRAGDALRLIVERVAHISTLVSEIASGAGEQSTGLAEINIGVTQLDQVTQQNAAMVEESTAASQSLHHEATSLAEMVARFTTSAANNRGAPVVVALDTRQAAVAPKAQPQQRKAAPRAATGTSGVGVWQDF